MTPAFIEHRPLTSTVFHPTSHFVIILDGQEVYGNFSTQESAKKFACKKGYKPGHVARLRHLQNRKDPAHWRSDPC